MAERAPGRFRAGDRRADRHFRRGRYARACRGSLSAVHRRRHPGPDRPVRPRSRPGRGPRARGQGGYPPCPQLSGPRHRPAPNRPAPNRPAQGPGHPLGVWLHAVRPVPDLVRLARAAEDLGAYALLLADEGIDRDIYVSFAAIAAATTRIRWCRHHQPSQPSPRRHRRRPGLLGRARPGPGRVRPRGRRQPGFDPMGIRPPKPFSAVAEAIDVVGDLLAGQTVDHVGQFTVKAARLPWSPGRLPSRWPGEAPGWKSWPANGRTGS